MEQEWFVQTLTIAGPDSGSGTGIQVDLKTFQMRGVFGTSVVTVVTAQNTLGVAVVHLVPTEVTCSQVEVVRDDFQISAFKLGMLGTAEVIECVIECLRECGFGPMVLDPVMIAKDGTPLLHGLVVAAIERYLLSLADVLTPNLPETQVLIGADAENAQDTERTARILQDVGVKTVVIKGDYSGGNRNVQCTDWVFLPDGEKLELPDRHYPTPHTHGTDCTFSACVTAELTKGFSVENAVKTAKTYAAAAIANPLNIGSGHGPVSRWAYRD